MNESFEMIVGKAGTLAPLALAALLQSDIPQVPASVAQYGILGIALFFAGVFYWVKWWPWYTARQEKLDAQEVADKNKLLETIKEITASHERQIMAILDKMEGARKP